MIEKPFMCVSNPFGAIATLLFLAYLDKEETLVLRGGIEISAVRELIDVIKRLLV